MSDASNRTGAVCLDGSPGGYFIRRGDPSRWILFMQGGGWCVTTEDCATRARGSNGKGHPWLGSSIAWPNTYTDIYEGSKLFAAPPFNNFTIVYAPYCDGGSWTGAAKEPVTTASGDKIYYRGRLLLDALIDSVLSDGLSNATELLFAGCSAGALTTLLHADYVAARMPAHTHTLALSDAMYSLEHDAVDGSPLFPAQMQEGYKEWNAASSGSVNAGCLTHYGGAAQGWHCLFGANVAPFVQTPLFILQSKYDTWQGPAIIGANASIANVSSAVKRFWVAYGQQMVELLDALPAQHGSFLTNCPQHCQSGCCHQGCCQGARASGDWGGTTINSTAMGDAFASWYTAQIAGHPPITPQRWIERCDVTSCGADSCGSP
jgi:hypothetical protein